MQFNKFTLCAITAGAVLTGMAFWHTAQSATTTTTFNVSIIIEDSCEITNATDLDFGTNNNGLSLATTATSTISVRCSLSTPFDVGLDEGDGSGATTSVRKLTNGSDTVDYELHQDVTRLVNWGNAVGTDTFSSVGTGLAVPIIVYGRVPAQSAVPAGTYSDIIEVTVTY